MKNVAGKLCSAPLVDAAIGATVCGLAAIGASAVAAGHSWQNLVPLVFVLVLLVIAGIFGSRAGILGTVVAALIFAAFLFTPTRSVSIASESARSNLGWMLLIGIAFSFLFAPPTSGFRRH
jgi:K+-sensing histidine kinase KdpD